MISVDKILEKLSLSKPKGEALFLHWHQTGVLLAKGSGFEDPIRINEIISVVTLDHTRNPLTVFGDLRSNQKGYADAYVGICHPAFFHMIHEVEPLVKAKDPEYFPGVVKEFLSNDKENVFYHVLNAGDGKPYSPDNVNEKQFIISGIKTSDLSDFQETIVEQNIYPRRIECTTLSTIGMLKKMAKKEGLETPLILLEIYSNESLLVILPPQGKPVFRQIHSGELAMCEKVRDEFSLKDIASSRKLLHSNTIDLTDIGRMLINPIFKEIAAIIGLFEVETGQSVGKLYVSNQPPNHRWISELMARDLGVDLYDINHRQALQELQLEMNENQRWDESDTRFLSLFSMIGSL